MAEYLEGLPVAEYLLGDSLLSRDGSSVYHFDHIYRLIGKLTDFLQLQEFSFRRHTQVASSPFAARLSSRSYRGK